MAHRESNYIAVRSEYGKRLVLFDPGSEYLFKLPFIQEAQPRIH